MFNVIEALWLYSSNRKVVDDDFINSVINMHLLDLKGYMGQYKYGDLNKKEPNNNTLIPMSYSYINKTIIIDKKAIIEYFEIVIRYYSRFGFSDIYLYLIFNTILFRTLIHELDHAYQYKKAITDSQSLEGRLLGLNFYVHILLSSDNTFDLIRFISKKDKYKEIFDLMQEVDNQFGREVLYERLAEIDSSKTAIGILEAIDSCYINAKKIIDIFKKELFDFYKQGYSSDKTIVEPTYRYINEMRKLNIREVNKYIDKKIENHYGDAKTPEERFKLGLFISNQEMEDIKCKILGQ